MLWSVKSEKKLFHKLLEQHLNHAYTTEWNLHQFIATTYTGGVSGNVVACDSMPVMLETWVRCVTGLRHKLNCRMYTPQSCNSSHAGWICCTCGDSARRYKFVLFRTLLMVPEKYAAYGTVSVAYMFKFTVCKAIKTLKIANVCNWTQ